MKELDKDVLEVIEILEAAEDVVRQLRRRFQDGDVELANHEDYYVAWGNALITLLVGFERVISSGEEEVE